MERWCEVFEDLPDMVLLFDRNWRVDRANRAAEKCLASREGGILLGMECSEILHDRLLPSQLCPICRQKFQRRSVSWSGRAPLFGSRFHVTVNPAPEAIGGGVLIARLLSESGEDSSSPCQGGQGTALDVIRSKGMERALNRLDLAVHVIDLNSHEILWANELKKRQFGRDIVGMKCYEAIEKSSAVCPSCPNGELVKDGVIQQAKVWLQRDALSGDLCLFVNKAFEWPDGRMAKLEMVADIFDDLSEFSKD